MLGQAERLLQLNSLMKPDVLEAEQKNIIAFTSGKGGTGKSFLVGNIAADLAFNNHKVLLVDADINFGNQHALFNISARKTLYDFFKYNHSLEDLIQKSDFNDNLSLILGDSGKLDHPKLNEDRVNILYPELKQLSVQYDYILLDTSSGMDDGSLQLLLRSNQIVLVTTPEPTSVMDGYVIFKMLKSNGFKAKTNVIVNKCFKHEDATEAYENLKKATEHFLKIVPNYLGEIKFSEDVVKSIQSQNLITRTSKSAEISNQINQISKKLKITTIG